MEKFLEFIRRVFTSSKFSERRTGSKDEKEDYNVKSLNNGSGDRKVVLVDPGEGTK